MSVIVQPTKTLLDKLWSSHEILLREDGSSLLWVDRHLVHEGSHHAFAKLKARGATVAQPDLTFAVADHYVPTRDRQRGRDPVRNHLHIADATINRMITTLQNNAHEHGIEMFGLDDPRQGIVHVIGPELGLTLPGLLITCGDSHTSTHGAFGALAFGIGATEVAHVLATQTLWQKKPKSMRIQIDGQLPEDVTAKDIALHWIAKLGTSGALGHAIEYCGSTVDALSMEARMTLCNLSIEGGGRFGMIAPDATTLAYVEGRQFAPTQWSAANAQWQELHTDEHAKFDKDVQLDASSLAPVVTWGTSPEQAVPVDAFIPALADMKPEQADAARSALEYMGLDAGQMIEGISIDQIFIGSCTNARIEDIRAAAAVLYGRKSKVPGLISPGSTAIKAQAEREGLDRIFIDAGLEWASSGCSSCVGMNGDTVASGKRCASTTNRNFRGRQGRGSRTHLMSPAMVAAAAVAGKIVDVRRISKIGATT
jgi:3-isopropylmalate/(R)-2-methylmalate dehydratase large subunit